MPDFNLTGFLSDLVQIDTTNPPGNETPAANYVKCVLESAGIPTKVYESADGRGNAIARLTGDGSRRPLLLLSHLDVVNAKPEQWTYPPFSGKIHNGAVWGRGSLDCKRLTVLEMGVMLMLKHKGASLKRDVILAATADEESGGSYGVGYLVENHFATVDAEFCINEGGGGAFSIGKHTFYTCNTGEKGVTRLRLTAKGKPGHASVSRDDTAIARLAEAVLILSKNRLPVHPTSTVTKFISGVLSVLNPGIDLDPSMLSDEATVNKIIETMAEDNQRKNMLNAVLRNTATPTILQAGYRLNIIPEEAVADVDGRILPGQKPDDFVEEIRALVGHLVDVTPLSRGIGSESPVDTLLFRTIEESICSNANGAKVVPTMVSGSTDAKYLRARGITTYGFDPAPPGEDPSGVHGIDERCSIEGLKMGLKVLYDVVERLCT